MGGLLVLLRHGQSRSNLEEKFTGSQDVDLTEGGREGARHAARLLADAGLRFDAAFCSRLKRAIRTLGIVLDALGQEQEVHVSRSWRLNERHYGALQGVPKAEAEERFGEDLVRAWRRGYRSRPPAAEAPTVWPPEPGEHLDYPQGYNPLTESLEDVSRRVLPYWSAAISPAVTGVGRVLVVAHGNSLRALVKHLDGLSEEGLEDLEIPPATPLVYELDDRSKPTRRYRLEAD